MKLVAMKKQAVPGASKRRSPYRDILSAFVSSGEEAARLDGVKAKANSAATQLRRYVNADKLPVQVKVVSGDLFLVRAGRAPAKKKTRARKKK